MIFNFSRFYRGKNCILCGGEVQCRIHLWFESKFLSES